MINVLLLVVNAFFGYLNLGHVFNTKLPKAIRLFAAVGVSCSLIGIGFSSLALLS